MGTTVSSLGNKTEETSSSEGPSWVVAFDAWKDVCRVQEHPGFVPWA